MTAVDRKAEARKSGSQEGNQKKTGFLFHELYMWHDTGNAALFMPPGLTVEPDEHGESPKSKRRMRNLLDVSGVLDRLDRLVPVPAKVDDVVRFHTSEYVETIRSLSADGGGDAGELTPFGTGSYDIAMLSVGGVISAAEAVWTGRVENAYALVRPPGHQRKPTAVAGSASSATSPSPP